MSYVEDVSYMAYEELESDPEEEDWLEDGATNLRDVIDEVKVPYRRATVETDIADLIQRGITYFYIETLKL